MTESRPLLARIEVGIDAVDLERIAAFWSSALDYSIGDFDRARVYLDLVPPDPSLPVIYLQRVQDRKATKNRLHLDLYVPDANAAVDRLTALGAKKLGDPQSGSEGGWWQVMSDPEGNEFCVCEARAE